MRKPFIALWILALAIALFVVLYLPVLTRYRELKMQQSENARQIDALQKEIIRLEEERGLLLEDPDYLEKVIRKELGLVRPGEVVYKFVEEPHVPHEQSTTRGS